MALQPSDQHKARVNHDQIKLHNVPQWHSDPTFQWEPVPTLRGKRRLLRCEAILERLLQEVQWLKSCKNWAKSIYLAIRRAMLFWHESPRVRWLRLSERGVVIAWWLGIYRHKEERAVSRFSWIHTGRKVPGITRAYYSVREVYMKLIKLYFVILF